MQIRAPLVRPILSFHQLHGPDVLNGGVGSANDIENVIAAENYLYSTNKFPRLITKPEPGMSEVDLLPPYNPYEATIALTPENYSLYAQEKARNLDQMIPRFSIKA